MCGYESCVWSMLCPHRFCPSTWEGYSSHPKWLRDSWTFSCMDSQRLKVSGLVFTAHTVKHYYTLWNNEMAWWCHTLFSNLWWQENLLLQYNSTYVHTHLCNVLYRMWLVYQNAMCRQRWYPRLLCHCLPPQSALCFRYSLRCLTILGRRPPLLGLHWGVCESTGWMPINLYLPLHSLILPVSVCVAGWMSA